jgi:hypothetical protein
MTTDHDISVPARVRVGLADGETVSIDRRGRFVRVKGIDLRTVAHRTTTAREVHPDHDVLVDIEVMIATSAAEARARLASAGITPSGDSLVYVGTPTGLAGLVTDIHALDICDGAILRPLLPGVAELIRERVLAELSTMGPDQPYPVESWSA